MGDQDAELAFENEVRRVARWIYPGNDGSGSALINGRERDGIFVTDEMCIAIEATISKTPGKAKYDAHKLLEAMDFLGNSYPDRPAIGLFVTPHDPTEHQRAAIAQAAGTAVVSLSLDTFRSKIIDVGEYLSCRDAAPFGSAKHPLTNSTTDVGDYDQLDMLDVADDSTVDYATLLDLVSNGQRAVVIGDYGAGKSMTLRELYLRLATRYRSGSASQFPLHINARDHQGQTDPVEAIERHARRIGFARPEKLVRAWRSGMCILLLDGFDEIAPASLAGVGRDPDSINQLNYRSVELLRQFVRESPVERGLVLSGRSHYFRNIDSMRQALALQPGSTRILSLSDFTAGQMRQYLSKRGWSKAVPDWLPRRPLLLGWLASRNYLAGTLDLNHLPPAEGWDWLLTAIFDRDSEIEGGIDGGTLRQVLERVATIARSSTDGMGPIYFDDVRAAFRQVLGYAPDDQQEVLLRRLPGLAIDNPATGSKRFIDFSLADTARAGDVVRHVSAPDVHRLSPESWEALLGGIGLDVCARAVDRLLGAKATGAVSNALRRSARDAKNAALTADLLFLLLELPVESLPSAVTLSELVISEIRLGEPRIDLSNLEFYNCIVDRLEVGEYAAAEQLPRFYDCNFTEVDGVARASDLPDRFVRCEFDRFVLDATTTNALLSMDAPVGYRVGLTVLRKLYAQRGGGRKEDALRNGLPPQSRQYVAAVLNVLSSAGLAVHSRRGTTTVWLPNRSHTARVRRWLSSPSTARDDVITKLSAIV